jgi:hypothetical protein
MLLAMIPQGEVPEDRVAVTGDTDDSWVGEAPDYLQLSEEDLA